MIEKIVHKDQLLAIILRHDFSETGIHFFTPDEFSQQLAYMKRPKDYTILPHVHNSVHRDVTSTQEALFIKKGKLRVDFYSEQKTYLESRILEAGDVILLVTGGHGFQMLEEVEMIEVKQGPYIGDQDKTRFRSIPESEIKITEHS